MSAHSWKIGGKIGEPSRKSANNIERLDRQHIRQIRWAYRYLRTCGAPRQSARTVAVPW